MILHRKGHLTLIAGGNPIPRKPRTRRPYDRTTRRIKMFDGRELFVPVLNPNGVA